MNRQAKIKNIVAKHLEKKAAINEVEYQNLVNACKKAKLPHIDWFWKGFFVPVFKVMGKYKRETASTIFATCFSRALLSSEFRDRVDTHQAIAFNNLVNKSSRSWDSLYSAFANMHQATEKEEAKVGKSLSNLKVLIEKCAAVCKIMRAAIAI